ncbi:MAG: sigma-70 family RNA polymerase sigma factor [candidate division Zixibacteria bacterium]|nr:sigma-70 family RNA polymerase sigma factor [candidate division Zixibacteria bacterium]
MPAIELGKRHAEFEKTILSHSKFLFYTAFNLTKDKARAEDLIQETFLKAYNSFSSFQRGTNSRAWLSRIMVNTYINNYHKLKREITLKKPQDIISMIDKDVSDRLQFEKVDETDLLQNWFDDEVKIALDRLPEKYRSAVIMFDIQGHTYQELAETFNCAIGTIKSRLFRGRKILKKLLKGYAVRKGIISIKPPQIN